MKGFADRLRKESNELKDRTEKLRAFIWDGDEFRKLCQVDQALLIEQLALMRQYNEVLFTRLARIRSST